MFQSRETPNNANTATASPLRLRLHYKAACVGGVRAAVVEGEVKKMNIHWGWLCRTMII